MNKLAVSVVSFPRSGTHLLIDILRNNFPVLRSKKGIGKPLDDLYVPIDILVGSHVAPDAARRIQCLLSKHSHPIFKTHYTYPGYEQINADRHIESELRFAKSIHVVRSPTKVAESFFEFAQSWKSSLPTSEHWLADMGKKWASHTKAWLEDDESLTIRFEDILSSPTGTLAKLEAFLSLKGQNSPELVMPPRMNSLFARVLARLQSDPSSTEIGPKGIHERKPFSSFPTESRSEFLRHVSPVAEKLGYGSIIGMD